jgi:hypothetical protein
MEYISSEHHIAFAPPRSSQLPSLAIFLSFTQLTAIFLKISGFGR